MDIFGENPQLVSIVIAVILLVTGGSLLKWWVEKLANTATTKGERAVQTALKKHGKIKAARVALEYEMFKEAAEGELNGILGYETRPLVSADYTNDIRSSIIDAPSTMVVNGTQVKVYAWYDNEMGYAYRLVDVALMVGKSVSK